MYCLQLSFGTHTDKHTQFDAALEIHRFVSFVFYFLNKIKILKTRKIKKQSSIEYTTECQNSNLKMAKRHTERIVEHNEYALVQSHETETVCRNQFDRTLIASAK